MKGQIAKSMRRLIAEYLTIEAERFFLEQGIDYKRLPKKQWAATKLSVVLGQPIDQAIKSPKSDPAVELYGHDGPEVDELFKRAVERMREIYAAQMELIHRVGLEKQDIAKAKKVPACLADRVVERMDAGDDFETAVSKAIPKAEHN